ncbi:MAG: hypothetical protein Q7S22_05945, partial [Candidatus Micrarchaeota archaeon]|nr:hypothetical protein [Candidatus Micrarchaeota archaeon]
GAAHGNPESKKAIMRTEFTKSEHAAIKDALAPFRGLDVAVRSDECTAAGVGLWHSDFALVYDRKKGEAAVKIVKLILASEFSKDVTAFKRRVGLPMEEYPGVLVMPVIQYAVMPHYSTIFHTNAIVGFTGADTFVAIGAGIGGANNQDAPTSLLSNLSEEHLSERNLMFNLLNARGISSNTSNFISSISISDSIGSWVNSRRAIQFIAELKSDIAFFQSKLPPGSPEIYLELAYQMPDLAVLQCAEIAPKQVKLPEVSKTSKVFWAGSNLDRSINFGTSVSGRGIVQADKFVVINGRSNIASIVPVNKEGSPFVIFMTALEPEDIVHSLGFSDYSNAVAIVSSAHHVYSVGSHLNGALREAGILVVNGQYEMGFLKSLRLGTPNHNKFLICGDDRTQKGFVMSLD